MATSIVQIFASLVSYLAAKGIDAIIGKWIAYVNVAWESSRSEKALEAYRHTIEELSRNLPEKHAKWDEWRKSKQGSAPK